MAAAAMTAASERIEERELHVEASESYLAVCLYTCNVYIAYTLTYTTAQQRAQTIPFTQLRQQRLRMQSVPFFALEAHSKTPLNSCMCTPPCRSMQCPSLSAALCLTYAMGSNPCTGASCLRWSSWGWQLGGHTASALASWERCWAGCIHTATLQCMMRS